MSEHRRAPNPGPRKTGGQALAAAAARLVRTLRADPGHDPEAPEPTGAWQQTIDDRLRKVEQAIANQNRILLLSFVAIVGDLIVKVLSK